MAPRTGTGYPHIGPFVAAQGLNRESPNPEPQTLVAINAFNPADGGRESEREGEREEAREREL